MQWPTVATALSALLSAVVAGGMSGDRRNCNTELVAQGIADITSPLFGGIRATGAIARTATNIRSGAKTRLAGLIEAGRFSESGLIFPRQHWRFAAFLTHSGRLVARRMDGIPRPLGPIWSGNQVVSRKDIPHA